MYINRHKSLKVLSSLALAGLLLLGMGLGLAQAFFTKTRVTTASGSGLRQSTYPSLSADGTKVAFSSDSDFLGQGIPDRQFEIWLYDTATMTLTRVTTASASGRDSQFPSLSADGTKVAFQSDSDFLGQGIQKFQDEIWLYNTATMSLTRVTTASASDRDSQFPSLSADGTKVAFQSDSDFLGQGIVHYQYEIWLYDTATLSLTRVTTASASGGWSGHPSLSADGTKVVFQSYSDFFNQGIVHSEIWLYDTATMTLTRVTTDSDGSKYSLYPSLSADGTKVAFQSNSVVIQDYPYEIWLYDTATLSLTRVTTSSDGANRSSQLPSLNADGTKVAFQSDSDFLGQGIIANQPEIWLYDTATMTLTRVTFASDGLRMSSSPSLSADGTKVAFFSDSGFPGQDIPWESSEIWLYTSLPNNYIYLPAILKG